MSNNSTELKKELRLRLRARVQVLSAFRREEASARACALLQEQPIWKRARAVLFYAPLPNELNIWALIPETLAAGKVVCLPRFNSSTGHYDVCQIKDVGECEPGKFGVKEPRKGLSSFPLKKLDFILAPGVGFDSRGGRLGRGGGFYDRLLAQVTGIKCGVAFDEQIEPHIPVEPHDIRLDFILTPTRWLVAAS